MKITEGIVVVVVEVVVVAVVVVEVVILAAVVCDAKDSDFEALIAVELEIATTVTLFVVPLC
jgi:hypothetical protein